MIEQEQQYLDDSSSYLQQCSSEIHYEESQSQGEQPKIPSSSNNQIKTSILNKQISDEFSTSEFQSQAQSQLNLVDDSEPSLALEKSDHYSSKQQTKRIDKNIQKQDQSFDLTTFLNLLDQCQQLEGSSQLKKCPITCQKQNNPVSNQKYHNSFQHKSNPPQNHIKTPPSSIHKRQLVNQQKKFGKRDSINVTQRKSYKQLSNPYKNYQNNLPYERIKNHSRFPSKNNYQYNCKKGEQFASQNYLFWGVLISIKLSSFMNMTKNVLVVPFVNSQFDDPVSKIVQNRLKYNLKEIAIKQTKKCQQRQIPDGHVFSVKAKGLQGNYRGIYFLKGPQKQGMKYYDSSLLKKGIERVFNLLDCHREQHVVFAEFGWGGLSKGEICEILMCGIFREINEKRKEYKCGMLREVVISVGNCQVFELYSRYLRFYIKQMTG